MCRQLNPILDCGLCHKKIDESEAEVRTICVQDGIIEAVVCKSCRGD